MELAGRNDQFSFSNFSEYKMVHATVIEREKSRGTIGVEFRCSCFLPKPSNPEHSAFRRYFSVPRLGRRLSSLHPCFEASATRQAPSISRMMIKPQCSAFRWHFFLSAATQLLCILHLCRVSLAKLMRYANEIRLGTSNVRGGVGQMGDIRVGVGQ